MRAVIALSALCALVAAAATTDDAGAGVENTVKRSAAYDCFQDCFFKNGGSAEACYSGCGFTGYNKRDLAARENSGSDSNDTVKRSAAYDCFQDCFFKNGGSAEACYSGCGFTGYNKRDGEKEDETRRADGFIA